MSNTKTLDFRDLVGLNAAYNGDVDGLRRFIQFFGDEIRTLSLWADFPRNLQMRLAEIGSECGALKDFLDGYLTAISAPPSEPDPGETKP